MDEVTSAGGGGCIVCAMTTPTFADVDEALARGDYRAALSLLESLEVVGEDACYRRDIQAAACADRLGRYPLCEEYATRARAYGDDMADPFALIARAQRRQGLVEDAEATASAGMRLHPRSAEIARELTLCLVDLGRYDEALPVSEIATDGLPDDVELLMAYGRLWAPVEPNGAQWAFGRATSNAPDLAEAKFAYDSLAHPLKGAGRSSYAIEMEPAVAEAYGRMLKRVTFALDKAWIFAIFAGFGCGIGYVATLRVMTDELAIFFFLLYAVMSLSGYLMTFAQIALFNRVLPRGVRLTFRILRKRFPDLGSSVMDFVRMIVLAGLILFGLMALTR